MRHTSPLIRHEAAYVFGQLKAKVAIEELSRSARNDSEEVIRIICVRALGEIHADECVPGLRMALQDRSLKVRQASFEALRAIGGTVVENAVSDLLDDHDADEQEARAHQGVRVLRDLAGVDRLAHHERAVEREQRREREQHERRIEGARVRAHERPESPDEPQVVGLRELALLVEGAQQIGRAHV